MKLLATISSPYARKVRIAFAEKKIEYTLIEQDPRDAGSIVGNHNPLSRIPVLVLEDGTNIFDSRVIVEYIDLVSPVSRLIPGPTRQRVLVKRWEALADGVLDEITAAHAEAARPKRQQSMSKLARHASTIEAAVATMARDLGDKAWCNGEGYTLADIATGVALGHLDAVYQDLAWREASPNLSRLVDKLSKRASFENTRPV
jgi:glutathione S-transferase